MDHILEVMRWVQLVAFGLLALACFRLRRTRGGPATTWLGATFGALALVLVLHLTLADAAPSRGTDRLTQVLMLALMLYPYLLYRWWATFGHTGPRFDRLAAWMTAGLAVATIILPRIPAAAEPRPLWYQAFVLAFVLQWTILSIRVLVGLWSAGTDAPTLARRRTRLLAMAAAGLIVAMVVSSVPWRPSVITLGVQIVSVLSAGLFFLGFAPPWWIRGLWRRPEMESMRGSIVELMSATTQGEVTSIVLPRVAGIVGARAVALTDDTGKRVLASRDLDDSRSRDIPRLTGISAPDGEIAPGLIRVRMRAGSLLVWAAPVTPFFGSDEIELVRSLAALADLALERCELFEAQRHFIAQASHELRTPVTTLVGLSQTLGTHWERLPARDVHQSLEAIARQGSRLGQMVADLLDLSSLDRGAGVVDLVPVRLDDAVGRVIDAVLPPNGATAHGDVPEGITVVADPLRLELILTNLVRNAFDHGARNVRVTATPGTPGTPVTVEVTDDGPGIPDELVGKIFDPFVRGDGSRMGSGLGLAISSRAAIQLHGDLVYDRTNRHGARFLLRLQTLADNATRPAARMGSSSE